MSARSDAALCVIAPRSHHVVRPLLTEVAAGILEPQFATAELERLVDFGPVDVRAEPIDVIDVAAGEIRTSEGRYPFDYLLIALDGEPAIPSDWRNGEWLHRLHTDSEAVALRNQLRRLGPEGRPRVAVIGAGPIGTDLAASLAAAGTSAQRDASPSASFTAACDVVLVESQASPLPEFPGEFGEYATQVLTELGVDVRCRTAVVGVNDGALQLADGQTQVVDVAIWAGGLRPTAALLALAERRFGRPDLLRDRFLRVEGAPNVTTVGAHATTVEGSTGPRSLAFEVHSGRTAARNLLAAMVGRAPEPIRDTVPLIVAPVGRGRAAAMVFGFVVRGRAAWPLYRLELARQLPRMSHRLALLGAWSGEALSGSRQPIP